MTSSNRATMFSSHLSSTPTDEFKRMCDNLDAQNKLALESGMLPPEEEALIRESLYPPKIQNSSISGHFANIPPNAEVLVEIDSIPIDWKHTPNHFSTRGMMLSIPPGHEIDIESDCARDVDDKAPAQPKVPPSNLVMKLMERIHG